MSDEVEGMGEQIAELAAHLDAAAHRLLTVLRAFDERGGWYRQGAVSCAHWLSWRVGWDLVTARERVRVARKLGEFPAIDDALRRGELSYSKVRALVRIATPANEAMILEQARLTTASQLEILTRKYALVQRHGQEHRPQDDLLRRYVRRRDTDDGMVKIVAVLHPEEAELVWTMLDHAAKQPAREPTTRPESPDAAAALRPSPRAAASQPIPCGDPAELSGGAESSCWLAEMGSRASRDPVEPAAYAEPCRSDADRNVRGDSAESSAGAESRLYPAEMSSGVWTGNVASAECAGSFRSDAARDVRRDSAESPAGAESCLCPAETSSGAWTGNVASAECAESFRADAARDAHRDSAESSSHAEFCGTATVEIASEAAQEELAEGRRSVFDELIDAIEAAEIIRAAQKAAAAARAEDSTLVDREVAFDDARATGAGHAGAGHAGAGHAGARHAGAAHAGVRHPGAGHSGAEHAGAGHSAPAHATVGRGDIACVDLGPSDERRDALPQGAPGRGGGQTSAEIPAGSSVLRQRVDANQRAFDRADGLVAVAQAYLRGDRPQRSPIDVTITIPASSLREGPADTVDIGCMGGTCVSAETVRRLSCDAGVIEVTEDDQGVPLSVGRKRRTIAGSIKRALLRRDTSCAYPGCANRTFLEGHHIKHWADGGETTLDNGVLLCSHHHRFVHEYGYRIELDAERRPRFRDPEGRLVAPVPIRHHDADLGWPRIRAMNEGLGIDAGTIACEWDGSRADYGRLVYELVVVDRAVAAQRSPPCR